MRTIKSGEVPCTILSGMELGVEETCVSLPLSSCTLSRASIQTFASLAGSRRLFYKRAVGR
jgi:hypothetical protein